MLAPVIVFAYNRLNELEQTINALKTNKEAENTILYINIDGPKDLKGEKINSDINSFCNSISGFEKVIIRNNKENKGLSKSVINGVSEIINIYGKVIVVEDDIVVSNNFLKYMNDALDYYYSDDRIWSIGGYLPNVKLPINDEVYFSMRTEAWGWATWKDRWNKCDWNISDFDDFITNKKEKKRFSLAGKDMLPLLIDQQKGKIQSWSIRFDYNAFKNNGYTVHPPKSLTANIGCKNGTNFKRESNYFDTKVYNDFIPKIVEFSKDMRCQKICAKFYHPTIFTRIKIKIQKIFGIYYKD